MYYDFKDYLNNVDLHLSQTQKIFMMEHAQDIINDINLKIQENSYRYFGTKNKGYRDFSRFRYISYLFKVIFDKKTRQLYFVSPYNKDIIETLYYRELVDLTEVVFLELAYASIRQFGGTKMELGFIREGFKMECDIKRATHCFAFYDDHEVQEQMFLSYANGSDLEQYQKLVDYELNGDMDYPDETYIELHEENHLGYQLTFSSDEIDKSQTPVSRKDKRSVKPAIAFNIHSPEVYDYMRIDREEKNDEVVERLDMCHIIPHKWIKYSDEQYPYNYIYAPSIINKQMTKAENIGNILYKNDYSFHLLIKLFINKETGHLFMQYLYTVHKLRDRRSFFRSIDRDRGLHILSDTIFSQQHHDGQYFMLNEPFNRRKIDEMVKDDEVQRIIQKHKEYPFLDDKE